MVLMESFTASESNLARTQTSSLGEVRAWLRPAFLADFPRQSPLCLEMPGRVGKRTKKVLFIHYCHFNHLKGSIKYKSLAVVQVTLSRPAHNTLDWRRGAFCD